MKFNIAIIPPDNICNKAIAISEELYKRGGKFVLGYKVNTTHITIAHFECDDVKVLDRVIDAVDKQIKDFYKFNIRQDAYRINNGWIDLAFELNKEILSIYEIMLGILRKNNCVKTSDSWDDNMPHITFSRFDKNDNFDIETLPKHSFSFTVDKIGIFELGEHGTNKRLLKEFELQ